MYIGRHDTEQPLIETSSTYHEGIGLGSPFAARLTGSSKTFIDVAMSIMFGYSVTKSMLTMSINFQLVFAYIKAKK